MARLAPGWVFRNGETVISGRYEKNSVLFWAWDEIDQTWDIWLGRKFYRFQPSPPSGKSEIIHLLSWCLYERP